MRAMVIEDSRLAREGLIRMLQAFAEIEVIGQAENADAALALIRELRPELLFLDIHMPGASGFELLEQLDYTPRIIFTTAYSEHAIRSFDYHTVDYLLKPISADRLAKAIAKISEPSEQDTAAKPPLDMTSRVFIKDGDHCHLVLVESISYIESCKNYVRVYFADKKVFVKKSMNTIDERLPPKHFFRISRQHIVNLQAIAQIAESVGEGYELTMSDGAVLEVSRRNAIVLKERLGL